MINKLVALLLALTACGYGATVTFYTDKTAFLAATAVQTIDFEGLAPAGGTADYSTASGLTIDSVNFVGPFTSISVPNPPENGYSLSVGDADVFPSITDFGTGATLQTRGSYQTGTFSGTSGALEINLPANTTAIGLNLATIGISSGVVLPNDVSTLEISIDGGAPFSIVTMIRPDLAFAGFTSDGPIGSLRITAVQEGAQNAFRIVADDVLVGSAIPEPSTVLLVFAGLGAVGLRSRFGPTR